MSRLTAARLISISFSTDSGTGKAFDTEAYLRHADTCLAFVRALRFAPYTVRSCASYGLRYMNNNIGRFGLSDLVELG